MAGIVHYPIDPTAIYRGAGHDASRRAVLWPLVMTHLQAQSRRAGVSCRRPQLPSAYRTLHDLWRSRIRVLAANGWAAARNSPNFRAGGTGGGPDDRRSADYRYVCLTNCPPFAVEVPPPRGNPCQVARVCPMCYARRVVMELYKCVEWAFFGGRRGRTLGGIRLVAVRRTFDVRLSDHGLEGWLDRSRRARDHEVERVDGVRGHAVLTTLEPGENATKLRVRRSSLLLVPARAKLDGVEKNGSKRVLEPGDVAREQIGRLVAWAAAYPSGMVFGDGRLAAEICNLTGGQRARMFVTAGLLRNQQSRDLPRA